MNSAPAEKDQARRKHLIYGVAILVVIGVAGFISYLLMETAPEASRRPHQRQARLVEVAEVHATTAKVNITAHGQVMASQQLSLSAEVSGRIRMLGEKFVPGQAVKKGDVLIEIDASDYQLALNEARADLVSAKADLALEQGNQTVAEGDFSLLGIEASEQEKELILRKPQLDAAKAAVQSAEVAVERAKLDMRRTTVRAPFDAIIVSRTVGVGTQVSEGSTVLGEFAAANPYWVELLLSLDSLPWLEIPNGQGLTKGSAVDIKDTANINQSQAGVWQGELIQLLPNIESEGRRAKVLVEVNPVAVNTQQRLLINSYVSATIKGKTVENVYRLSAAWIQSNHIWAVRDETLVQLPIEAISREGNDVLAKVPLQTGDTVVSSLLSGAVNGMKVRVSTGDDQTQKARPIAKPKQPSKTQDNKQLKTGSQASPAQQATEGAHRS